MPGYPRVFWTDGVMQKPPSVHLYSSSIPMWKVQAPAWGGDPGKENQLPASTSLSPRAAGP
jgi:hypothetical protein